jgi:hypothetical protein
MRRYLYTTRTFASLTLVALVAGCASSGRSDPVDADLAIVNAAVIDVERGRVIPHQTVFVKDGRILAVSPATRLQPGSSVRTVDGTGKYLMPGLLDMHAHLTLSGKPTEIEMPLFVAHGVTGVRVMAADRPSAAPERTPGLDQHREWQARIASGDLTGPRLLALGSWPVNGAAGISDSMPAFFKARTREEGRQLAAYLKERGFDFIKVYNGVSREGYLGMAEEARRLGLPFAGHEPSALSAIELSNAGQKSIEHSRIFLFSCFPAADSMRTTPFQGPPAGRIRQLRRMVDAYDPRICDEVFRTFARNGTYITPTHLTRKMDAFADDSAFRQDERLKYLPANQLFRWAIDAGRMVAADSSIEGRRAFMDFYRKGLELTNAAYRAGVPVMLGTDAGDTYVFPGSAVHDELGELVKAGLSPAEALRAATLAGATYLGLTDEFGTVEPGRFADLVLLDANPLEDITNSRRIQAVVLNGRVYGRAALDSLLAGVEAAARSR